MGKLKESLLVLPKLKQVLSSIEGCHFIDMDSEDKTNIVICSVGALLKVENSFDRVDALSVYFTCYLVEKLFS